MSAVLVALTLLLGVDGSPWALTATEQAVRVETRQIAPDPAPPPTAPPGSACPQWFDTAMAAGWEPEDWAVLDYVMHRESRCIPTARNAQSCDRRGRYHAIGLTQLCGWGGAELYDPFANLVRARQLYEELGWHPWCLRGDPMTGSC